VKAPTHLPASQRRPLFCAVILLLACAFGANPRGLVSAVLTKAGWQELGVKREQANHKLFLKGRLNGRRLKIAIDTGSPVSCIRRDLTNQVRRLNPNENGDFNPNPRARREGPDVSRKVYIVVKLGLDGVPFEGVPVLSAYVGGEKEPEWDMLLGFDFLRLHRAFLFAGGDPGLFVRTGKPAGDIEMDIGNKLRDAGFGSLDLIQTPDRWLVKVQIDGSPATLILDTGSHLTVVSEASAERIGLAMGPDSGVMRGIGKARAEVRMSLPARVEIADQRFENVTIGIADMRAWGLKGGGNRSPDGILGQDFIERANAVIDCAGNKLFVKTGDRR
jgi:hypothetical protein